MSKSLKSTEHFIAAGFIAEADRDVINKVADHFSFSMTNHMQQQVGADIDDPVAKQFVPSAEELEWHTDERVDPIGDDVHTKVKGIIHRYPDRCLLLPVTVCPVYCRYCFRREKIGPSSGSLRPEQLDGALDYIEQQSSIWEVILTGGDPLILHPKKIQTIFARLSRIDHVKVIRLHSRVPIVDPPRINDELIRVLSSTNKAVYVVVHANHSQEFSAEVKAACAKFVDHGIPLLSQSVLLKGINDNIIALSNLMRSFVENRIKPYYLHHLDKVKGTGHFRVSIAEGQALLQQLQGTFSGLCQPSYVLDIPGGFGKVPIHSSYIHDCGRCDDGQRYLVEDYQGEKHSYLDC